MVTAPDLIVEAERRGACFRVLGERLEAAPARVFDSSLAAEVGRHKSEIVAILRECEGMTATDAVLAAQRLLRECKFLAEPPVCAFLTGRPGEECRRCGASWSEHYPPSDGRAPS
jgi:hypothetical protein